MNAKLELTNLINPMVDLIGLTEEHFSHLFKKGLKTYLNNMTEKYIITNTFIHRFEKVNFYEAYFPLKLSAQKKQYDFSKPRQIFKEFQHIALIGGAGSGKSTLTKFLFLQSIKENFKIPVLIELRFLNDWDKTIEEYIVKFLLDIEIEPKEEYLKNALFGNKFLFIFDGFDEIYSEKKRKIINEIDRFVDRYNKNTFLITGRPGSGAEHLYRFNFVKVQPLTKRDVVSFIQTFISNIERKERLLQIVRQEKNNQYLDYLKNPLLLSMFITTFEKYPEIPKQKNEFYSNVFETLNSLHDGITKNSFLRPRVSSLNKTQILEILYTFSYSTLLKGNYSFTRSLIESLFSKIGKLKGLELSTDDLIVDLETSISIWVKEGLEYKFPHRSMQEYFAAKFFAEIDKDSDKGDAYKRYTHESFLKSSDNHHNLWDLLMEIDNNGFQQLFVLQFLTNFQSQITGNTNSELMLSFIEQLNVHIQLRTGKKGRTGNLYCSFSGTLRPAIINLLSYLGKDKLLDWILQTLCHRPLIEKVEKHILSMSANKRQEVFNKVGYIVSYPLEISLHKVMIKDRKLKEIIVRYFNNTHPNKFIRVKEEITRLIAEISSQIGVTTKNNKSLINL